MGLSYANSVRNPVLSALVMIVFGIGLMVGGHIYRRQFESSVADPQARELLESLSIVFTLLPGIFIAIGLIVAVLAISRAKKGRRQPDGIIRRDD